MIADERLLPLLLQYGLILAVALILLGQLGVPTGIPAEVLLLLAGGYAVRSIPDLLATLALIGAADVVGSLLLFFVVRRGTAGLARRAGGSWQGRTWLRDRLRHRGAIFVVRLLPLVRVYGTVGSGLLRTRTRDFLAGSVPAGLLWAGTPLTLGFLLREHVAAIVAGYPTGTVAIAFTVPGLLLTAVMFGRLRRGAPAATPAPVPIPVGSRGLSGGLGRQAWLDHRALLPALALQPRPVPAFGPYLRLCPDRFAPPHR